MKTFFLFVVLSIVVVTGQPPNPPTPTIYWYLQKFDHFNGSDTRTWTQKYLVYDKYYIGKPKINHAGVVGSGGGNNNYNNMAANGPIFFCPGGESEVEGGYEHNGLMFELGEKLGAFLLFPEHRFYGLSLPFGAVDSYKPENIVKLTIEQAMADYIEIINFVKKKWNIPDNTPLISFGGSYPGDLTTYLRVGYPDVIDAGLASSAPLRYHLGEVEGGAFYEVVTKVFATVHPECPRLVRTAFRNIISLAATPEGRAEVSEKLALCPPLQEGEEALRILALWAENAFATLGMEDYPYPLDGLPPYPLRSACTLMATATDPIVGLRYTVGLSYNSTSSPVSCFNISEEYYPCADITGCGGGVGDPDAMSWDYQSCTEIVSNVDTNNVTDMFPPAPYDEQALASYCLKQWNAVPKANYIPNKYNYNNGSRLILSNGALDPWYPGGVLPGDLCPVGKEIYCLLIDEAAHHLDLRGTDPLKDPPAVIQAREFESALITAWVDIIRKEKTLKTRS